MPARLAAPLQVQEIAGVEIQRDPELPMASDLTVWANPVASSVPPLIVRAEFGESALAAPA